MMRGLSFRDETFLESAKIPFRFLDLRNNEMIDLALPNIFS